MDYLNACSRRCNEYFENYDKISIQPKELLIGATEYFNRGGKRLRPAFLSLAAGAVGGRKAEMAVTPALVSVELFHTFTLVHDDIIDNDGTRRGGKSVHILVRDMFGAHREAEDYGRDVAILAGDTLHALSVRLLLECSGFSPKTVILHRVSNKNSSSVCTFMPVAFLSIRMPAITITAKVIQRIVFFIVPHLPKNLHIF